MVYRRVHKIYYDLFKSKPNSNSYLIMKMFYRFMHIFFCLDFGFFEHSSNVQRYFWKSVTIIQSIAWCCLGAYIFDDQNDSLNRIWSYFYLAQYFLSVTFLALFNPASTFRNLYTDLELIDFMLKTNNSYNLEIKILFYNCLHIVFRLISCTAYVVRDKVWLQPLEGAVFFLSLITITSSVLVSSAFVFYSINCRLKKFSSILKATNSDITSSQNIYKIIMEKTEFYKKAFDSLFIIALLFNVPEIMGFIYFTFKRYQNKNSVSVLFRVEYIMAVEFLLLTYAPALYAGKLSTQTENIKIILHDKLMDENDATKVRDLVRFIRYVEARPCRFRVCKIIPLDANLIGMILNFCATYLIVLIQFTMNK